MFSDLHVPHNITAIANYIFISSVGIYLARKWIINLIVLVRLIIICLRINYKLADKLSE